MPIRSLFVVPVAVAITAMIALSAAELAVSMGATQSLNLELFTALAIALLVALAMTQAFFRWRFDPKHYNAVDYACLLLGIPLILGAAQLVYDQYARAQADVRSAVPLAITNAALEGQAYQDRYCGPAQVVRIQSVTGERCRAARDAVAWLGQHPNPALGELEAFVRRNFRKDVDPHLSGDALAIVLRDDGKSPELRNDSDYQAVIGRFRVARHLIDMETRLAASQADAAPWRDLSANAFFKLFSLVLALNVILFKLGLILSKLRRSGEEAAAAP